MIRKYKELIVGILIGIQLTFIVNTSLRAVHSGSGDTTNSDDPQRRALSVAPEAPDAPEAPIGNHEKQIRERAQFNARITHFNSTGSDNGMSACLYTSDDRIRLIEWIPYHYTIMPLHHLIVAIDPVHTMHTDRIIAVLNRWKHLMNITIITDDAVYLGDVPYDKAWKRKYWLKFENDTKYINPVHLNTTTVEYQSQAHKRRQNVFTAYCHKQHHLQGHDWVMNLDSDEFLIPNFLETAQQAEANINSSNFFRTFVKTSDEIERERQLAVDVREHLPPLKQHVTVANILHSTELERCLRMPALNFSAHSSPFSQSNLLTQTQTKTGPKEGRTTKVLLDLSRATPAYLTWEKVVNVHNPNKRMCGWQGVMGSGTDYISSIFRYNHYVAGSLEVYLERQSDFRRSGADILAQFRLRNFEPESTNTDIFDWLPWFESKVGAQAAKELLHDPLVAAYEDMQQVVQERLSASELSQVTRHLRSRQ